MDGLNYKFYFFHQDLNQKIHSNGRSVNSEKKFRALVQTSESLKIPNCAIDCDSSRALNFFHGYYRLDFFHQGLNLKQNPFTGVIQ